VGPTSSPISAAQRAFDTEPQSIDAPMSAAAAFLVLIIKDDEASISTARSVVASTDDLVKDVRIRADGGVFTCNVRISHRAWGPVTGKPAPKELAPFREMRGARHTAVATAGGLLYHIRAESTGVIIEF
jgi:putative iron-dependent peroxidase